MYKIVDEAECKRHRNDCSNVLKEVCIMLKEEKNISAQFTLVGSGARNMVTRNGNGPYDLDYNLEIIKASDEYWNNLRKLKDTVRVLLDKAEGLNCFSNSQDSTSCLTALLHFNDEPKVQFKFDVAIVARNKKGTLCRLIHNKNAYYIGGDQYVWNEIPNSKDIKSKVEIIKKQGYWLDVREKYVELKNIYLSKQDKNHPSFVCYIEAVNIVFNRLKNTRRK